MDRCNPENRPVSKFYCRSQKLSNTFTEPRKLLRFALAPLISCIAGTTRNSKIKTSIGSAIECTICYKHRTAIIIMLMRTVIAALPEVSIAKPNTAFDAGAYYIRTTDKIAGAPRLELQMPEPCESH